jgi:hypothetical protein
MVLGCSRRMVPGSTGTARRAPTGLSGVLVVFSQKYTWGVWMTELVSGMLKCCRVEGDFLGR